MVKKQLQIDTVKQKDTKTKPVKNAVAVLPAIGTFVSPSGTSNLLLALYLTCKIHMTFNIRQNLMLDIGCHQQNNVVFLKSLPISKIVYIL